MLFQTVGFVFIFLPVFLVALGLVPYGLPRTVLVVAFSYLFYSGSEPLFALLLLTSTLVDFVVAQRVEAANSIRNKKFWLVISIATNLGILGFFKYGKMILAPVSSLGEFAGLPTLDQDFFDKFVLPSGISFYTFQSMSYTIDVYRGQIKAEKNIAGFMNYVAYLPQLIAGPIERFSYLYPQLQHMATSRIMPAWSAGFDRIALGIAQKLLIADACGRIVDHLVIRSAFHTAVDAWAIGVAFGMQIYYDFAAYTHIAIGIALLMNVRLSENFNSPYKALSIQDFWRRWHITLSNWFRDYLYIPLGGSKFGTFRTVLNVAITFLLCGLWHGAGWNFVAWGALHALFFAILYSFRSALPKFKLPALIAGAITFACVHFAWVPFRLDDGWAVISIWKSMLGFGIGGDRIIGWLDFGFVALVTLGTLLFPNASKWWPGRSGWFESMFLWTIAVGAIFITPEIRQFIYFQF